MSDFNPDDFDPSLANLFDESLDAEGVIDVTSLPYEELLEHYFECDNKLLALHEVRFPRTAEGREIHSFRVALRVEMLKREQQQHLRRDT